jgi:hypothetical protein
MVAADHALGGVADAFHQVVVEHVAGADQADAGGGQAAVGELLQHRAPSPDGTNTNRASGFASFTRARKGA